MILLRTGTHPVLWAISPLASSPNNSHIIITMSFIFSLSYASFTPPKTQPTKRHVLHVCNTELNVESLKWNPVGFSTLSPLLPVCDDDDVIHAIWMTMMMRHNFIHTHKILNKPFHFCYFHLNSEIEILPFTTQNLQRGQEIIKP